MDWEIEDNSGQWNCESYWIGDYGCKLKPYVLTVVHPANFDLELGRFINLKTAKKAAEEHAGQ